MTTQNECRCEKNVCGCTKAEPCTCGKLCACKNACACGSGCSCTTAK
jgi:hypothetical protein